MYFSGNMDAKKLDKVTIEKYLQIEQESKNRFEYHDGYIFALAGGTLNHGLICGNIFGEIRSGLREKNSS
ncbi:MAG: Uma2 family endonuclease [Saprospirales bacterium]|nr:Uma2 family endonuclease [Saprospirales bacterium]